MASLRLKKIFYDDVRTALRQMAEDLANLSRKELEGLVLCAVAGVLFVVIFMTIGYMVTRCATC